MSEAIFQLGQKAFIIDESLRVLMVGTTYHKDPKGLYWDLPSGRVDEGEDNLSDALDREIQEELQIEVDVHDLLTLQIAQSSRQQSPRVLLAIYHCSVRNNGEPKPANEVKDFTWISIDEISSLPHSRYSAETIARIKEVLNLN